MAIVLVIKELAETFTAENPILMINQIGYETDTGLQKAGDGVTEWNSLDYSTPANNSFEQTLSGDAAKVPSSKAVKDYIDSLLGSS